MAGAASEPVALKVALHPSRSERVKREFRARKRAVEAGLDFVPEPLFVDDENFPDVAVATKFVEGRFPDDFNRDASRQLAACLARTHEVKFQPVADWRVLLNAHFNALESLVRRIGKRPWGNPVLTGGFTSAFREAKREAFARADLAGKAPGFVGLTHGDVSDNFLVDSVGKLWLVDWENSRVDDVVEEVVLVAIELGLAGAAERHFFEQYVRANPPVEAVDLRAARSAYDASVPLYLLCWDLEFAAALPFCRGSVKSLSISLASSVSALPDHFSHATKDALMRGTRAAAELLVKRA